MSKPKKHKPVRAWAVFESGKLVFYEGCDEYDNIGETHHMPAIFRRKHDAKKRGMDYRRVTITLDP